jgi:hypothetical protein
VKPKRNKELTPRLPESMRELLHRHGTVESRKKYRRHGRHMNPNKFERDIEDQLANSEQIMFNEEQAEYLSDYDWDYFGSDMDLHEAWDEAGLEREDQQYLKGIELKFRYQQLDNMTPEEQELYFKELERLYDLCGVEI